MSDKKIKIVGGGLAGSEAALQLAKQGWEVVLFEMRPHRMTPAHETPYLAELVCSNSLKSDLVTTASGLLKEEMRRLDCELLKLSEKFRVPAGNALAVERDAFAREVTDVVHNNPRIRVVRQEVTSFDDRLTIVATGPLSSEKLMKNLQDIIGIDNLYFYDAIAPIISAESINNKIAYRKARYDKGEADYLNCPFDKDQYSEFVKALLESEKYIGKDFERKYFAGLRKSNEPILSESDRNERESGQSLNFYENCIPIEELARRGKDTLRFGVMRPVGLESPLTGKRPYAIIQLRTENKEETAYNLVGCQTMMTQASQKRVFRMIPGLEKSEFYRYGSIHRNTYLYAPRILNPDFSLKKKKNIYIAGQLAGVEGYIESIASGMLIAFFITGILESLPENTIIEQLRRKLTMDETVPFTPVNANYGLLPPLENRIRDKRKKKEFLAERSLSAMEKFKRQ